MLAWLSTWAKTRTSATAMPVRSIDRAKAKKAFLAQRFILPILIYFLIIGSFEDLSLLFLLLLFVEDFLGGRVRGGRCFLLLLTLLLLFLTGLIRFLRLLALLLLLALLIFAGKSFGRIFEMFG